MKKYKWKILKTVLGLLTFSFLVSFSAIRHACKPLEDLDINIDFGDGKYFVNDSLVRRIVNTKDFSIDGKALGNLETSKIERVLDSNPFIRKSQVYKRIDGIMKVQIEQKTPIARINTGTDEYYLSDELTKIPLSNLYSAEVLLVGGDILENDFNNLRKITENINDDKLLKKHIIGVKKVRPNSFILLVNQGNYVIEFGALDNVQEKFEKLKLFYEQYLGKVGLNYYDTIKLNFKNQVVATKTKNNDEK